MRQVRAILLLPVMVTIVIPSLLTLAYRELRVGWGLPGPLGVVPVAAGMTLVSAGFAMFFWTVRVFIARGHGTVAPWDPTERLVVEGPYRHVRNPMIGAVVATLAGEAVLFGSWPIGAWAATFAIANSVYMPLIEEPGLKRRFGDEYVAYKRAVPRWLPRRKAWRG